MITEEIEIRNFMRGLTVEDIADSVHLFGADFDSESIASLIDRVISLYSEVATLKDLVTRNFESENHDKILVPQSSETQSVVIQDYYRKSAVLEKLLSNKTIMTAVISKIVAAREGKKEISIN